MARVTLEEIRASRPKIDRAKVEATTEADIRRHMLEDGEDPEADPTGFSAGPSIRALRTRLDMTQPQFADALRVPLATLRNWEQGRVTPDPAARSLLRIVARSPEMALAVLKEPA